MKAFAAWVLARRINALFATTGFTLLGTVFPPLILIGFASLALVVLRRGYMEGIVVACFSNALLAVVILTGNQWIWDLLGILLLWLLVIMVAQVYRWSATTAWMVNAAGLVGMLMVAGAYIVMGDPASRWMILLDQHIRPLLLKAQVVSNEADLDPLISAASQVLTGGMAAFSSMLIIISLLIARWWQAMLFNPGGFRREFHQLRLGRLSAWVMLLLITASLAGKFLLTTDLATVMWLLFFFQGIAVTHSLVAQAGINAGWLVSLYILLVLMPYYAGPVISGLGFVDTWFDFRSHLQRKRVASGESGNNDESGNDKDDPHQG